MEASQEPAARILIIDDELGMREGCRRALAPLGYEVSTAEHGVAGLRKLREEQFDLILVDAVLPGMGGLELLERIHEQDPDLLCVMLSGYATVGLAAQAVKLGAHDFLPKPFSSDELLSVVQQGLEERKRRLALMQQREQEEEARQLERARQEMAKLDAIESRFMLTVVHELRNPAGVIKNYLQLMRAGYVDDDERDGYLEKLEQRAGQLLDILDDLLELARLKETLGPPKLKPVAVADILEDVTHQFRRVAEAQGLQFEVKIEARPTMLAQPAHLCSLWTKLLDNALRYTPSGKVKVTLSKQGNQLISKVTDTGIGISTEDLTRIFQEFYRSEAAEAARELGTGLGLPIVNQIVEAYGGAIEVDSTPEQGSTFTIKLPVVPSDGVS